MTTTNGAVGSRAELLDEIEHSQRFLLATHENPDGDALGSLIAMQGVLRALGKDSAMFLSAAITQELKDPRVGFVTVTAVETSPDLRHARVFVSVLGDEAQRGRSLDGLRAAHGYLQRRLNEELRIKHTPSLDFIYDDSVDRSMRIQTLLDREGKEAE